MPPKLPCPAPSRRALYRHAKRTLHKALVRRWTGSRAALDKHIRAFLRGKRRTYLFRLVRRHAFALLVATALLTVATAQASPPIELSDVASGTGGFVINGIDAFDLSGFSVSAAGDVNGDGLADLIVGAQWADANGENNAGESYVIFGKTDGTAVDLSTIASGTGGFIINGFDADDHSGVSVCGAGDVNGDDLADLIVGARDANPGGASQGGVSYVVFGKADGAAVELSAVAMGTGGFAINGVDAFDFSGFSVSGAGDVNGDELADLIVGARNANSGGNIDAGESYVVFGKADGAAVELSAVAMGTGGFVINGIDAYDSSGISVSGAGDVNGDGLADLIVGADRADPGGRGYAGESYVVFGKASGTAVELSVVASGTGGFVINGINGSGGGGELPPVGDRSGGSVSGAGDVNGDGLADLIIGAREADPGGDSLAGESYVVFGKADGTAVELSAIVSGTGGFVINGIDPSDRSGSSVSGAGDVNGDGLADLIVGAWAASPGGDSRAGESYLVFGKADGTPVELSTIASGTGGFVINGIDVADYSGISVSEAGDVNGDGLADLIIGAERADPGGDSFSGESYVVFSPIAGSVQWVDFAFSGTQEGTEAQPFQKLEHAANAVTVGGVINIKGGTGDANSPETTTINQAVTINAINGTVSIGNPATRDAQRGSAEAGFVSKKR